METAGGIDRQMTFEFHFDTGHLTGYETKGDVTWIEQNGDWFDPHADFARDFLSWLRSTPRHRRRLQPGRSYHR